MSNKSDTKSRKYQLTINNPQDYNITHETINNAMKEIKWDYYCLCDEIGAEEKTPHTHLYFECENAIRFSKVKKLFPTAHIETAKGTAKENRDYILKDGKYLNSDKKETNLPETFEEYGELPLDKASKNEKTSVQVVEMIKDGYSNTEIIDKYPSYMTKIQHLNKYRQELLNDKIKGKFRFVKVHYIYGESRTGKTRYVMDKYGYDDVYRVSDYGNPFDEYNGQPVLLLDEFYEDFKFELLLKLLEGYPLKLPARYENKSACYSEVYIISNIPLQSQYKDIRYNKPKQWNALINRFSSISRYEFINNTKDVAVILEDVDDYKIKER